MKVVAFIEPPQGAAIEKILRHCGLWNPSTPRAPPSEDGWVYEPDADWDSHPASSPLTFHFLLSKLDLCGKNQISYPFPIPRCAWPPPTRGPTANGWSARTCSKGSRSRRFLRAAGK